MEIPWVYFSAHWCGPCRGFTPKLAEWYKNDLSKKNFEIIFVSSDRDQAAFDGYLSEMPWLALPFSDRGKGMLSDMFDVEGIPTFAIVGPDGKIINLMEDRLYRLIPRQRFSMVP